MIKRFKIWFNRKTIEEKILFIVPAIVVAGTLLALFFVILSKQGEKKNSENIADKGKIESQWVINSMSPNKEENPVIFDWLHNCLGMHAISNAIPSEDFVLMVFYGNDNTKFAMDYYIDVSSEDDIYPIYGRGIILKHLDDREAQEMAIWRQNNLPVAEESIKNSGDTGGSEKYHFYICDSNIYDFHNLKLKNSTISFDAFDSTKPAEDLGASVERLQNQSYIEQYVQVYGIPTEWLRVSRANGKLWCGKLKDADLPIFDEYNYLEKIYCISKNDWKNFQNYSVEKKNNYINKFIVRKTGENEHFRIVTLNRYGYFSLYGFDDLESDDVNRLLNDQGYISLEEAKQFMKQYAAYVYGIGDDMR